MSYRNKGVSGALGDVVEYDGAPAEDPRIVKRYGRVKSRYRVRNVSAAQSPSVPGLLAAAARARFPADNVTAAAWYPDGRVGFDVIVAGDTRLGTIRQKNYQIGQEVGPRVGAGTEIYDAMTNWDWSDIQPAPGAPISPTPAVLPPAEASSEGSFFSRKFGGVPTWMLIAGGILTVGVIGAMTLKKPGYVRAGTVSANPRRRRKHRHLWRVTGRKRGVTLLRCHRCGAYTERASRKRAA